MKLLVIDPYVTRKTPTMRSWVDAFPAFQDLFEEIEIWASECDIPEGGRVTWTRVLQRMPVWSLHALDFQWRATRMLEKRGSQPNTLVMVTGCNVPRADVRYMHFWNRALLEERASRSAAFRLKPHQRLVAEIVARTEKGVVADADSTREWWVVSRSIAEKIKSEGAPGDFKILPNPYDPRRFHPGIRDRWRAEMRAHYRFQDHERVLVFSSFGHFERKGLPQVVQTIARLRERNLPVRLLVLGGTDKTVAAFQRSMHRQGIDLSGCTFTGLVTEIERHLVAADGLFFPSHFEAFSLAEIEAAALGLRLYLTPHYGTEMILRDPRNGRILPWDPEGMAEILEDEIRTGAMGTPHQEVGDAIDQETFASLIRQFHQEAIERRLNLP